MGRRKAGKPRRPRPGQVFIRDERWDASPNPRVAAAGFAVHLPGVTTAEYRRVRELADAGQIHDPLVVKFVRAFARLTNSQAADLPWTADDLGGFLRWLGFTDADAWTAVDDAELYALLRGEGASDVW